MPTLAAISLLWPAMLGGLALVALPVLAHLLNRRARRTMVFPDVALLAASSASQSSLWKLRRWLLLLLRCVAVLLLVLAFAQPILFQSAAVADSSREGAAVVLVVDLSASTAQQTAGVASASRLYSPAFGVLDGLRAGIDRANLVFARARPTAAFPEPTANLDALRAELRALEPTAQRADLAAALALAGRQLSAHGGARHLVVFTDLQATNWDGLARLGRVLPNGTRITVVPLDTPPPDNAGIAALTAHPPLPVVGQAFQVKANVQNFGGVARPFQVRMTLNDRTVDQREVTVGPWSSGQVVFEATLDEPGDHRLGVRLEDDDALPADNAGWLSVRAVGRLPAVIIGDDDPARPGSASYFLDRALAPRGDERDPFAVRHVGGASVDAAALSGAAAVFISAVGTLTDDAAAALHAYMDAGGGVVMFCGDGAVQANLAALERHAGAAVAPWRVGPRQDLLRHGESLTINQGQWRSPGLSVFDVTAQQALERVRFTQVWPAVELAEDALVLLRFNDGSPALAQRAVGAGRFVMAAFGPAQTDTDLSKYGSFVALVQHLAVSLRPHPQAAAPTFCGQPLQLDTTDSVDPVGPPIRVVDPNGDLTPDRVSPEQGVATVVVTQTDQPGVYTAVQGDRTVGQAAVNVDPRESDLRRSPEAELLAALSTAGDAVEAQTAGGDGSVLSFHGVPLWGWMLAGLMLTLALESSLLGWVKR